MNENENRRTKLTKLLLKESLLHLMETKPINKITVTEICKGADLNRGTFYTHYLDAYDLLEQIQQELFSEVTEAVDKLLKKNVPSSIIIKEIFELILKNKNLCKVILSENGDKAFLKSIINLTREKIISDWMETYQYPNVRDLELLYIYTSSGIVGIVENWIQNDFKQSAAKLSAFVNQISNDSLFSLLNKDKKE